MSEDYIEIVWSIEDVQSVDETLDDDQARKVLQWLKHKHDATIGINWDVISDTITTMYTVGEL